MDKGAQLRNPHLDSLKTDYLCHLGLTTNDDLEKRFSDVRFVCMGASVLRMRELAGYVKDLLGVSGDLRDIGGRGYRYSMFKVGPVLSICHGMGGPSFSVLLHEILKLIKYAKCENVTMIRIGPSSGVAVPPGTVVVSTGAVDGLLRESHEFHVLGKRVTRPCVLDEQLANEITAFGLKTFPSIPIINGKTMSATDFYEAQGRLDGAFCNYDNDETVRFLHNLRDIGVCNMEMEVSLFAAMCAYAQIRAAVVSVTLVDRLGSDQMSEDKQLLIEWQKRPQLLVGAYIRNVLRGDEDK